MTTQFDATQSPDQFNADRDSRDPTHEADLIAEFLAHGYLIAAVINPIDPDGPKAWISIRAALRAEWEHDNHPVWH
jgi:hypothetical protein